VLSIFTAQAQKGTIKIFSEIKGVQVFLDEENKGTDIINIDSVVAGSHYLKITKSDAIVYGELITVKAGEVTTILVKNDNATQEKILESKYSEQQEYRNSKLSVMISTKYVTQTNEQSKTKSTTFPGYYVATSYGKTNTTSTSTTTAVEDWFVTQGGVKKISEQSFASLTNNQNALQRIERDREEYQKYSKKGNGWLAIGATLIITSVPSLLIGVLLDPNVDALITYGVIGFLSSMLFIAMVPDPSSYKWQTHYMTLDEAIRYANQYNQRLKARLGLPEDFE